jgi:hypothetical protein
MVIRADVARVKFSVDDNVRLARVANATTSGRQSTEAWLKTLREAAVDTDRINSMCSKVRDPRLYEVLWASFWQYLDSLALSDTVFCQDYDQLRKSHIFADEKQTQAFFNRAITWLIARLSAIGCELVFRDTSSSRAPVHPHHKFDMSFVSTSTISARDNVSVLWNEVVMIAELKQDLDNAVLRKEVLIQTANGLVELRAQQINREREFAFISDARGFQLFVRTDDRGSDEFITSGLLPLFTPSHSGPTAGFVVLVNLLVTTAAQLGLPPRADSSFKFPMLPKDFVDKKAQIIPHRTGSESKPDIYFVGQV